MPHKPRLLLLLPALSQLITFALPPRQLVRLDPLLVHLTPRSRHIRRPPAHTPRRTSAADQDPCGAESALRSAYKPLLDFFATAFRGDLARGLLHAPRTA